MADTDHELCGSFCECDDDPAAPEGPAARDAYDAAEHEADAERMDYVDRLDVDEAEPAPPATTMIYGDEVTTGDVIIDNRQRLTVQRVRFANGTVSAITITDAGEHRSFVRADHYPLTIEGRPTAARINPIGPSPCGVCGVQGHTERDHDETAEAERLAALPDCRGGTTHKILRNGDTISWPTAVVVNPVADAEPATHPAPGCCPRCSRRLVGYDGLGKCPSPYCPGPAPRA